MQAISLDYPIPGQRDARADDGRRDVFIAPSHVIIARQIGGVRMRIRVEASAYRGVVLTLDRAPNGGDLYRIKLWHADADFTVLLGEARDDRDIVAAWKAWSAYLALPKFIEREPGELEGAERRIGAVALGRSRPVRRRGAVLTRRRGRMALRRKVGASHGPATIVIAQMALGGWEGEQP